MWRCFVRDQARVPSVAGAGSSLFRNRNSFFDVGVDLNETAWELRVYNRHACFDAKTRAGNMQSAHTQAALPRATVRSTTSRPPLARLGPQPVPVPVPVALGPVAVGGGVLRRRLPNPQPHT